MKGKKETNTSGQTERDESLIPTLRLLQTHLMNAKKAMSDRLTTQPASAKALGMVRAPVPTIRLNMYTSPTCRPKHRNTL